MTADKEILRRLFHFRSFGHRGDEYFDIGINAKLSEVHAAYGLAQFDQIDDNLEQRKERFDYYAERISKLGVELIEVPVDVRWNYSYFILKLDSEKRRDELSKHLLKCEINSRKYFSPSLNTLRQFSNASPPCPQSEYITKLVLAIPFYSAITRVEQDVVIEAIIKFFK